jgi:hypothetical protein
MGSFTDAHLDVGERSVTMLVLVSSGDGLALNMLEFTIITE